MTHKKNEVVEKMKKELLEEYYDESRWYDKQVSNVFFINSLIKDYGIKNVASAGLDLLLELEDKEQIPLLDSKICGIPKNALSVLFKKAIKEGHEEEMAEELLEMYKKGNKSSLFLFEILENTATVRSMPFLEKLSREMEKGTRFSSQGDAKKEFIEKYRTKIQNLLNKFKPQLPFPQPQH